MSEDGAASQKTKEYMAIKGELSKISSASDLLRSVEDERQYNKLQLLLLSICFFVLGLQKTELSIAHGDVMPESIPKFGNSDIMYEMYEHHIKTTVMKNHLNWGKEQENVDRSDSTYVIYSLMTVHILSFYIARTMIGTKKYATAYEKMMFPLNFFKLSIMLFSINIPVTIYGVSKIISHGDEMGRYFKHLIIMDLFLIYLTHLNIWVEFKCNCRNDLKRTEYILEKANAELKK
jgi:hypothetical protein